jgi:hypothetical protein
LKFDQYIQKTFTFDHQKLSIYIFMKRVFILLVIVACGISLYAQQPVQQAQPAIVDSTAKAKIIFEELNHNFGVMTAGADGSTVFKFKNEGKVPLILTNVQASCGCTTPSWTREPVAPGATGEIKVTYDTKRMGPFSKSVTVTSNAENPTVILRIAGEVKQAETAATPQ